MSSEYIKILMNHSDMRLCHGTAPSIGTFIFAQVKEGDKWRTLTPHLKAGDREKELELLELFALNIGDNIETFPIECGNIGL